METNHLPHLLSLIVSDSFFENLPKEKQEILLKAAALAQQEARAASDARISDKIAEIEASGTQIITLDDALRDEMREASQPVYDAIREVVDKEIVNAYME